MKRLKFTKAGMYGYRRYAAGETPNQYFPNDEAERMVKQGIAEIGDA